MCQANIMPYNQYRLYKNHVSYLLISFNIARYSNKNFLDVVVFRRMMVDEPLIFTADHPFIFLVKSEDVCYFMGRVGNFP